MGEFRMTRGKRPDGLCGRDGCGREAIAPVSVVDGCVVWLCDADLEVVLFGGLAAYDVVVREAE